MPEGFGIAETKLLGMSTPTPEYPGTITPVLANDLQTTLQNKLGGPVDMSPYDIAAGGTFFVSEFMVPANEVFAIPEPSSFLLAAVSALLTICFARRRRRGDATAS